MSDSMEDAIIEDAEMPGMDPGKMPTAEQLLELLDTMTGLSDEDKESLRADLLKNIETGNPFGEPAPASFSSQALILFAMLAFITLIFVFFGYKLYKSLIERERKREEKRKLKELKKKK